MLAAALVLFNLQTSASESTDEGTKVEPKAVATSTDAWRSIADYPLPDSLRLASDLRWADAESIYLTVLQRGAVRVPLVDGRVVEDVQAVTEVKGGRDAAGIWLPARVARTHEHLVVGAPVFAFGWKKRGAGELEGRSYFLEGIEDLDARDGQVALLGLRRSDDGKTMAPEGFVAWTGTLGPELEELRPLHLSTAGPGARPVESCSNFEIGGVRYLPDGRLVVAPGAEPGVYFYSTEGKLLDVWDTEPLGVGVDCSFDDEKRDLLSRDPHARWGYLNQFRTIDEILPFDDGPGLVVRRVGEDGTRWDLLVRDAAGQAKTQPLPFTSPSKLAHVRGDLRGGRAVFLIFDSAVVLPPNDPVGKSSQDPRLLVFELPQ